MTRDRLHRFGALLAIASTLHVACGRVEGDEGDEVDGVRQTSGSRHCAYYRINDCLPTGHQGGALREFAYDVDELCWRQSGSSRHDYCWQLGPTRRGLFASQTACRQKAIHASHSGQFNATWHVPYCEPGSTMGADQSNAPYNPGAGLAGTSDGQACQAHGTLGQCLKTWDCSQRGWKATANVHPCSNDPNPLVQCCTPIQTQNATCQSGGKQGSCRPSCAGLGKVWVIEGICGSDKVCCIKV